MKKLNIILIVASIVAGIVGCSKREKVAGENTRSTAADKTSGERDSSSPAAVLNRAELTTTTGGDNKDHDTCVFCEVTTADGQTKIAHIDGADCGPNDSTEYNDRSVHPIQLTLNAAAVSKDVCQKFNVKIWQKTHGGRGHDKWIVDKAEVVLYFTDSTNLKAEKTGITLESNSENDAPEAKFSQGS